MAGKHRYHVWLGRAGAVVAFATAGVLGAVLLVGHGGTRATISPAVQHPPRQAATASAAPAEATETPGPAPVPAATAPPARLIIPRLAVNAAVEQVGVDASGRMGVPASPNDVAWYSPGPFPGDPGDAVIDGHLDWYNTPRAVFADLARLQPGDEIDVVSARGRVRFAVTAAQQYPYTAQPPGLFDATGEPRLSLITCAGRWDSRHGTYADRLVVSARRLGPEYGG